MNARILHLVDTLLPKSYCQKKMHYEFFMILELECCLVEDKRAKMGRRELEKGYVLFVFIFFSLKFWMLYVCSDGVYVVFKFSQLRCFL